MNFKPPIAEDQVEPLVRAHLEGDGRSVDVAANLAAIVQRLTEEARVDASLGKEGIKKLSQNGFGQGDSSILLRTLRKTETVPDLFEMVAKSKQTSRRGVRWKLAAAACLVATVGLCSYVALSPEPASAYAVVSAAQSAASKNVDRCYRIESDVPKAWLRGNPFLRVDTETLLWTRGDRFRVITTQDGKDFTWGQDEQRRVWVVCGLNQGLRFDDDEVPPMFARTRAYLGLDVRRLINRFLNQFDLQMEKSRGADDARMVVIRATAKEGRQALPFNSARIEVELKTKVIRKMELARIMDGAVYGRFTFTLVDEAPQPDASYRLENNLPHGAEIFSQDRSTDRAQVLRELTKARRRG
ncbi:MAG: hypothetical protein HY288_07930 [Planctomycetia bacterium]|nr:hypothetical protein [Planctomycetia bacterium]